MKHQSSQQRHGQAWLPEEEQKLKEAFLEGLSIPELANRHERGNEAILKRLERLGLIEAKNAAQSTPALSSAATRAPHAGAKLKAEETQRALESSARLSPQTDAALLSESVDQLVSSLLALKAEALLGLPGKHVVAAVTEASERFDAALLSLVARQPQTHEPEYGDDPLPERLRAALVDAVRSASLASGTVMLQIGFWVWTATANRPRSRASATIWA